MPSNPVSQQRRPAIIPADAELTAEDIHCVKLRIGDTFSVPPPTTTKPTAYVRERQDEQTSTAVMNENGKRKASTSAEDHQLIYLTEAMLEKEHGPFLSKDKTMQVNLDNDTVMS